MLSVIIPTRNRSKQLEHTLRSFERQTLARPLFEIIVVDNGSTDHTRSTVVPFATSMGVRYFYHPAPGLHRARHVGFREAKYDNLVYVDDDIEAFPTMLEAVNDAFGRDDVALVGGKCIPKFETEPPQWLANLWASDARGNRIMSALSLIDLGEQPQEIDPRFVFGCNFSVRRQVLSEAQGFHPDGVPKELIRYRGDGEVHVSDFVAAKGYKALYLPAASVYHWVPSSRMTIEYFCQRAFYSGISASYRVIRKEGRIGPFSGAASNLESKRTMSTWRRLTDRVWRKGKSTLRSLRENIRPDRKPRRAIADAYQNGYNFHQRAARDNDLRAWILRDHYWDCDIPRSSPAPG
jgi:glycosyltransferase involved in cell wall biosynthesis